MSVVMSSVMATFLEKINKTKQLEQHRTARIVVLLTQEERDAVVGLADTHKVSASTLVRLGLLEMGIIGGKSNG